MEKTICIGSLPGPNLKSKIQNLKWAGIFAIALTFAFGGMVAQAQQPKKVPRIGYVDAGSPATTGHRAKAFVHGLRDLGYVEGENIVIEYRWAEGKLESLPRSRNRFNSP